MGDCLCRWVLSAFVLILGIASILPAKAEVKKLDSVIEVGTAMLEGGNYSKAAGYYQAFLPIYPKEAELYRQFAIASYFAREGENAHSVLDPVLVAGYTGPLEELPARFALGILGVLNGSVKEARQVIDKVLQQPDPPPFILLVQANILMRDGEIHEARDLVRVVLDRDPSLAQAVRMIDLLEAAIILRRYGEGETMGKKALDGDAIRDVRKQLIHLTVALITDAELFQSSMLTDVARLRMVFADCECVKAFDFAIAIARMHRFGENNLRVINATVQDLRPDDDANPKLVLSYAQLLALVSQFNQIYGYPETAFWQLVQVADLLDKRDVSPQFQLSVLRSLESLSSLLHWEEQRREYNVRAERLVAALTRRLRNDFLAQLPGAALAIPPTALMLMAAAFWLGMGPPARTIRTIDLAPLRRLLLRASGRAYVVSVQPWASGAAAVLAVAFLSLYGAMRLFEVYRPAVYRAVYPLTGVDLGLVAATTAVALVSALLLILTAKPRPEALAGRIDRIICSGGAIQAYLCFGGRHQEEGDLLHRQALTIGGGVPPDVVPFRRSMALVGGSIMLMVLAVALLSTLPPPPPEIPEPGLGERPPTALHRQPIAPPEQVPLSIQPQFGKSGLDLNTSRPTSDQLKQFPSTRSVAGLHPDGEPLDYLTGVPKGHWDFERRDTNRLPGGPSSGPSEGWLRIEVPRQKVPQRYRGTWREE